MKKINISNIITYIFCGLAVCMIVFTAYTLFKSSDNNHEKSNTGIFGYNFFVVLSGSMTEQFAEGDIAVTKATDVNTIKVGDIISFVSIDPSYMDEVVTHKIRSVTQYEGKLAFETYGTTTGVSDTMPALAEKVIGKYQFTIPKLGYAVAFIQGKYGFMICIIIPIAVIFIVQAIKLIKLLKNKDDEYIEDFKETSEET